MKNQWRVGRLLWTNGRRVGTDEVTNEKLAYNWQCYGFEVAFLLMVWPGAAVVVVCVS